MQGAVAAVSHHQGRALPPQEVGRSGGAFPEVSRRSPWVSPTPAITGVASVRAEGERSQHSAQGLASTPKAPCPPFSGHISPRRPSFPPPPADSPFLPPSAAALILLPLLPPAVLATGRSGSCCALHVLRHTP